MFQRSLLVPIQRGSRSRSRSAPPSNFQEIGGKLLDTGLKIAWFTSNSSHLGHKPVAKHVAIIQSFSDHLRSSQYTLNLIWSESPFTSSDRTCHMGSAETSRNSPECLVTKALFSGVRACYLAGVAVMLVVMLFRIMDDTCVYIYIYYYTYIICIFNIF